MNGTQSECALIANLPRHWKRFHLILHLGTGHTNIVQPRNWYYRYFVLTHFVRLDRHSKEDPYRAAWTSRALSPRRRMVATQPTSLQSPSRPLGPVAITSDANKRRYGSSGRGYWGWGKNQKWELLFSLTLSQVPETKAPKPSSLAPGIPKIF